MRRRIMNIIRTAVWLSLWFGVTGLSAQRVEYYHLDAVGSVRAISDQNGNEISRHDYLPFGEEWPGTSSGDRLRFAGKERDVETALDYLGARYLGTGEGRFRTVDPVMTLEANVTDPQRWNRYAYVRNNPVLLIDPNGKDWADGFWYLTGVANGFSSNFNFGATRLSLANEAFSHGQYNGDMAAFLFGAWEVGFGTTGGAALAVPSGGTVAVPAGAFILQGTVVSATATYHLSKSSGGRGGNQFRGPDPGANGRPHSRIRRDDRGVTHYETYDYPKTDQGKRVDVVGAEHDGVPTPHTVETRRHRNPRDPTKSSFTEGPTRPARSDEIPRRQR